MIIYSHHQDIIESIQCQNLLITFLHFQIQNILNPLHPRLNQQVALIK